MPAAARLAGLLAGIWAGALLAIGGVAAPAAFASVATEAAGRIAGRIFSIEAHLGLALAVALVLLLRRQTRRIASATPDLLNTNTVLVLGAIFCTVAGFFALQPMMAAARTGAGSLPFGVLHAASAGFYALKTLLVLILAWRLTAR